MVQFSMTSPSGALPTLTFPSPLYLFLVPSTNTLAPPIKKLHRRRSIDALALYLIHPKNQPRCPRDHSRQYTPSALGSRCSQEATSTTYYPLSRLLFSFQGSDLFHATLFLLPSPLISPH